MKDQNNCLCCRCRCRCLGNVGLKRCRWNAALDKQVGPQQPTPLAVLRKRPKKLVECNREVLYCTQLVQKTDQNSPAVKVGQYQFDLTDKKERRC